MRTQKPDILAIARGFREARVLLSALELGIFDALSGSPQDASAIACRADLDPRATNILLDALASIGVLQKKQNTYSIPESLAEQLAPDGPESILPALWHTATLWRRWDRLSDVVRWGRPLPGLEFQGDSLRSFIGAMQVGARGHAEKTAAEIPLDGVKSLLDLGGGPASYAIAFARRNPELHAVVFDLPPVTEMAQENIAAEGLEERISTLPGNYLTDPIGGPYDLVWISSIVHMHTPGENRSLMRKAAEALTAGGRIVVRDFLLDEDGAGPAHAALFAVNMLVGTEGGRSYRASEISEWLEAAGLADIEVRHGASDGLVMGRKVA